MPNQMPLQERRAHTRQKTSIGARVEDTGISYFTHLRNISRTGAFIHTFMDDSFRIGQDLIITFPFRHKKSITLVSRVTRVASEGIGVRFLKQFSE